MAREFGDNEPFWGETAYVMMHVVKWYVLKWCLLDFLGLGEEKHKFGGWRQTLPWLHAFYG